MVEYMVLMSLALLLLSVILYLMLSHISGSSIELNIDTAQKSVNRLRDKSDFIYLLGYPSKTETRITIPSNVERFYVKGDLILMRVAVASLSDKSHTDVYAVVRGDLEADFSSICSPDCTPGNYMLVIEHNPPPADTINLTVRNV